MICGRGSNCELALISWSGHRRLTGPATARRSTLNKSSRQPGSCAGCTQEHAMSLVKRRPGHLLTLLTALVGCLAAGLWIHHHFVLSTIHRAMEDGAAEELAAETDELLVAIGRLELAEPSAGSAELGPVVDRFEDRRVLPELRVTLTDSQWRILAELPASGQQPSDQQTSDEQTLGGSLTWVGPSADPSDQQRITGWLSTGDGRHVAVARRLPGRDLYAVVHYPLKEAKVSPKALGGSLPGAGVITWIWTSALLVVVVYVITTRFYDQLTRRRAQAEAASLRRIQSLERTRDAVIFGLAKLADSRDEDTGHHLERISAYASRLAMALRHHPEYRQVVTSDFVNLVGISSALHDIGKVGIEDAVLLKPEPLSGDERARMQQHAVIGRDCILEIERRLGTSNFLQMAREIAYSHHEKWDGSGYPDGLIGKEIPLAARIVALADVYEALSSARVYKKAFPHEKCVQIIRSESGKHFDPVLVETFLKLERGFKLINRQYNPGPAADAPQQQGDASGEGQRSEAPVVAANPLEGSPAVPAAAPQQT